MQTVSYELVSKSGNPVMVFDDENRARDRLAKLAERGSDVRIERVQVTRETLA